MTEKANKAPGQVAFEAAMASLQKDDPPSYPWVTLAYPWDRLKPSEQHAWAAAEQAAIALAAPPAEDDWQPIATMPENCECLTRMLDCDGDHNVQRLTREGRLYWSGSSAHRTYVFYQPTHWKPIQ